MPTSSGLEQRDEEAVRALLATAQSLDSELTLCDRFGALGVKPAVNDLARANYARPYGAVVRLDRVPANRAPTDSGRRQCTAAADEDHIARMDGVEVERGHSRSRWMRISGST